MNYIRTRNGIYKYDKNIVIEGNVLYEIVFDDTYTDYGVNGKYSRGTVLNQADTIEELCDEFVFICEDFNKPQLVIPINFEYCKKTFKHIEIYGAIWTDKGLIYVAKLNEKGEFKLI